MDRSLLHGVTLLCFFALLMFQSCGPSRKYVSPALTPEEATWKSIHSLEKQGNLKVASFGFFEMCNAQKPYVRSCYDYSRVLFELEKYEESIIAAREFVLKYPNNALAADAVERIARAYRAMNRITEGQYTLQTIADAVKDKDVWDSVVYRVAELCRYAENLECELNTLGLIIAKGRWGSQLWDNAIWRAIELCAQLGDEKREKKLLVQLISSRERSYLIASYNSPYHDDALLKLGKIYFKSRELKSAYKLFNELMNWKTSRMRDDGFLWAAKVKLYLKEVDKACLLLKVVIEKMPAANSLKEVKLLYDEAGCDLR